MKIAGIQIRRRFFVGVGLVVSITGVWFYWSSISRPLPSPLASGPSEALVRIAGVGQGVRDKVMEERAEYFDPTPLFLPTSRNFQQGELPARVVKQPGQVFRDFAPKTNFAESALPDYGAMDEATGNSLPEVLTRGNVAPFAGFGMIDRTSSPLVERGGFMEVKSLKNGILSLSETINEIALPRIDFMPVEFVVAVASTGLIGDPMMTATSGNDDVDAKMRAYLLNSGRIGERLAPGRYVVLMGP